MDHLEQELISPAYRRTRLQFALADLLVVVAVVGISCATVQAKSLASILGTFLTCLTSGCFVGGRYFGAGWRGNSISSALAGLLFILVKRILLNIDIVDIGWLFRAATLCAVSGLLCSMIFHSIGRMARWVNEDEG